MQVENQNLSATSLKSVATVVILVVNALVWYLYFFSSIKSSTDFTGSDLVIIVGFNLLTVILSAFFSSKLIQRMKNRLKFLVYWMVVGVFLSPTILLVGNSPFFGIVALSSIIGAYFGFGFPVLLGYHSASTSRMHRAKVGGLILFFMCLFFALFAMFISDVLFAAIVLVVWKLCGLVVILFLKPNAAVVNDEVSYMSVLKTRSVLLYFIPWLIFSIVNSFAFPTLAVTLGDDFVSLVTLAEGVLAGVFAIVFGFLADRFGRKRFLFLGFTLLGLGYAVLGLYPTQGRGLLFYTVVDGAAWGIFAMLFLLTTWGDIAGAKSSEKFFVIGFLPYLFSGFIQIIFEQYVVSSVTNLVTMFSFVCFFLFITFIPLYLAPETMSEKDIRDVDLMTYINEAQKKLDEEKKKECKKKNST